LATPAVTRAEGSSQNCEAEKLLYELAAYEIGQHAHPANGTKVAQGSTVTLEAESQWQLHFSLASSETLLSNPDIDQGYGQAQPGEQTNRYTFSSTKATAQPGTVYWDASFRVKLYSCGGEERTFATTVMQQKANTFTVVASAVEPAPLPAPEPPPPSQGTKEGPASSWSARSTARLALTSARRLSRRFGAIPFIVQCTASCAGVAQADGFLLKPHRKLPLRALRCVAQRFRFAAAAGGSKRMICRLRARAVAVVRRLLRHRKRIELELSARATFADRRSISVSRSILIAR